MTGTREPGRPRLLDWFRACAEAVWELSRPGDGVEPVCRHMAAALAAEARRFRLPYRGVWLWMVRGDTPRHVLFEIALSPDGWGPPGAAGTVFAIDAVRVPGTRDDWQVITAQYPYRAALLGDPWALTPMRSAQWYTNRAHGARQFREPVIGDYLAVSEGRRETRLVEPPASPHWDTAGRLARELREAGWEIRLAALRRRFGIEEYTS